MAARNSAIVETFQSVLSKPEANRTAAALVNELIANPAVWEELARHFSRHGTPTHHISISGGKCSCWIDAQNNIRNLFDSLIRAAYFGKVSHKEGPEI